MPNQYFVSATTDPTNEYAVCTYYYDREATQPVGGSQLTISETAGSCAIGSANGSSLALLAATFKTIGAPANMSGRNFVSTDDNGFIQVPMPTDTVVHKGVVLLFSTPDEVENLYASADPVVVNSDD